jgi:hypothetical protein
MMTPVGLVFINLITKFGPCYQVVSKVSKIVPVGTGYIGLVYP